MDYSFDDVFKIGDGHSVCEDYSWSGLIQGKHPCAIISDGCSSSKDTDIGSRILVRSMIYILERLKLEDNHMQDNFHFINHLLGERIVRICDMLDLPLNTLDATILMSMVINDEVFIFNYGDGSIVLRNHTTDDIVRYHTDYPYNAPYYYSYTLKDELKMSYIAKFGQSDITVHGESVPVMDHINDISHHWSVIPLSELSDGVWTISVMSDGVETFFEGNNNVDTDTVVDGLTSFKNLNGEYIQRKVKKYLNGLAKNNIKHYDDISISSIKFEVSNGN